MITEQEYINAVEVVKKYFLQISAKVSFVESVNKRVEFLAEYDKWTSLKVGDNIRVERIVKHRPSLLVGDILTIKSVTIWPPTEKKRSTRVWALAKNNRSGKEHTLDVDIFTDEKGDEFGIYGHAITFSKLAK